MAGGTEEVTHVELLIDELRRELKKALEQLAELTRQANEVAGHVKDLETGAKEMKNDLALQQSTIMAQEHHISMLLESKELERAEAAQRERARSFHEGERRLGPVPGVTPHYPPAG